jgi:hypothetical protein
MCFFLSNTDALTPSVPMQPMIARPDHLADGTPAALLIAELGDRALELCFVTASRIGEDHA